MEVTPVSPCNEYGRQMLQTAQGQGKVKRGMSGED